MINAYLNNSQHHHIFSSGTISQYIEGLLPIYFQYNHIVLLDILLGETGMFVVESIIFNNGHIEIVAPSPKNNNPNISDSFLIIAEFLFIFCSLITSSSSLDMSFLLVRIYVLETFL